MKVFEDTAAIPAPPLLPRLVWVTYHAGADSARFACVRCQLVYVNSAAMKMTAIEPFLHFIGARSESEKLVAVLVPCKYVTYLELGPAFGTKDGGTAKDQLNILPSSPAAQGAMGIEKIEAFLVAARSKQGNGSP